MPKAPAPHTLSGLARLLAKYGERAFVVANGDSSTKAAPNRVLINVGGLRGFDGIGFRRRKVTIGAGARFGEILRRVEGENGLLKQAVSMMGQPPCPKQGHCFCRTFFPIRTTSTSPRRWST